MREHLYKGKRVDNGQWCEGQLVYDAVGNPRIVQLDYSEKGLRFIEVHPDTVCQFTGLLDKNGNKIFEGDIVTFNRGVGNWTGQRLETTHEVYFEKAICAFCMKANGSYIKLRYLKNRYIYKITGNIHDETH